MTLPKTNITPREKGAEMSSVLRPVRKRMKVRTLGPVNVIDRKEYAELDVDTKVELIRSLVPLGLLHVEELLDEEVTALAGGRYARKDASVGGRGVGAQPFGCDEAAVGSLATVTAAGARSRDEINGPSEVQDEGSRGELVSVRAGLGPARGRDAVALCGVVARIVTGPHDAHRQDPHRPMRYDTGRPRAVIRFKISQPRTTSLPCPAGLRARRPSPMMDLYRKNVFSTRP